MWNVVSWFAVGLVTCMLGGLLVIQDGDLVKMLGWAVIAVGGVVAHIGIIATGVFVALREHDRS